MDVPIQFNGSASKGTPPYSYQWSFGDGSTSTMQNPTHAYSEPSSQDGYQVTLYVSDSQGMDGWAYTSAYVTGDIEEPTANAGGPYQGNFNETIYSLQVVLLVVPNLIAIAGILMIVMEYK